VFPLKPVLNFLIGAIRSDGDCVTALHGGGVEGWKFFDFLSSLDFTACTCFFMDYIGFRKSLFIEIQKRINIGLSEKLKLILRGSTRLNAPKAVTNRLRETNAYIDHTACPQHEFVLDAFGIIHEAIRARRNLFSTGLWLPRTANVR
jgi:hypothetical protein